MKQVIILAAMMIVGMALLYTIYGSLGGPLSGSLPNIGSQMHATGQLANGIPGWENVKEDEDGNLVIPD